MNNINFLADLQNELNTQETDIQRSPRFWVIKDYKWVETSERRSERTSIEFFDKGVTFTMDEYIAFVLSNEDDTFSNEKVEEFKQILSYENYSDILNWISVNDDDSFEVFDEEKVSYICENTCFFTKQEALEHLSVNKHKYTNLAHTYAMTAHNAPTMERLLEILSTQDWRQLTRVKELI